MTATTSHTIETETNMHRMINWIIVFSLAYGSMVYWWTNSFHFSFFLQTLSPETTEYFANRKQVTDSVNLVATWWERIFDIVGPIITTAGVTYSAIFLKGLAEEHLRRIKNRKKK